MARYRRGVKTPKVFPVVQSTPTGPTQTTPLPDFTQQTGVTTKN
jgi:hypothetical protein